MKLLKLSALPKLTFSWSKLILVVLVVVLIAVVAGAAFQTSVLSWQSFPRAEQLTGSSKVKVSLSGQKIQAEFEIAPFDRDNLENFSRRLGVSDEFVKGVSLDIDEETAEKLEAFLPAEASMRVLPDRVEFSGNGREASEISIDDETLQSAALGGALKVEELGGGNFRIEIDNPKQVLSEATASGKLRLSPSLTTAEFWQLIAKVARIKLKVGGHSLEGVVALW